MTGPGDLDAALVERMKNRDEAAFSELVDRHHGAAVRLALQFVHDGEAARDAVQDAWLGVMAGIAGFEGRSSFRSWFFSIVANCAKKRARKNARDVPVGGFEDNPESGPTVPAARFATSGKWPGHWADPPKAWTIPEDLPDQATHRRELYAHVEKALLGLAAAQRQVMTMRDVLGMSAEQACEALGISEANQRVLLHRARANVRAALEDVLGWAP